MSEHTPIPWVKYGRTLKGVRTYGADRTDKKLLPVAHVVQEPGTWAEETDANADFIFLATSYHDALVKMLAESLVWQADGDDGDGITEQYWSPAYKDFMTRAKKLLAGVQKLAERRPA